MAPRMHPNLSELYSYPEAPKPEGWDYANPKSRQDLAQLEKKYINQELKSKHSEEKKKKKDQVKSIAFFLKKIIYLIFDIYICP